MDKKILVFIGVLFVSFIALCVFVLTGSAREFNGLVYSHAALMISPEMNVAMKIVSNLGEWFVYVPLALLLVAVPKTRFKIGVPSAIVLAVSAASNSVMKNLFHIARPDVNRLISIGGYGFPSGHAMNCVAFVGIAAYLFYRRSHNGRQRLAIAVFSILFMLLIGFDRIYLGVHSATDVIGGYLCGSIIFLSAVFIIALTLPV